MRHAAISGIFSKDEHFRATTLISILSRLFPRVVSECSMRQYRDFFRKDKHFRAITSIPIFPKTSCGNVWIFSGRVSTSGQTPRSQFSPDFFYVVSECIRKQYLDFSGRTSTSGQTPRSPFSPDFLYVFPNVSWGKISGFFRQKGQALLV